MVIAYFPAGAAVRTNFEALHKVVDHHRRYARTRDDLRYAITPHAVEHGTGAAPVQALGVLRLENMMRIMHTGFTAPFFKKTYFTQAWLHCVMPTLAQSIVGSDWLVYGQGICEKYNWLYVNPQAAISTPRQFGKTTLTACTICAQMEAMPGSHHIVLSTGRRASQHMIQVVEAAFKNRGHENRIKVSHPTVGSLIVFNIDGQVSKVTGVPANPRISTFILLAQPRARTHAHTQTHGK